MYRLAKAQAIAEGPRQALNDKVCGYYLTTEELRKLYAREGFYIDFSRRHLAKENWLNQIDRWIYTNMAIKSGDYVFFILSDSETLTTEDATDIHKLKNFGKENNLDVIV